MELYVNDLKSQIQLSRQTHDFLGLFEDITAPMITESITTSAQIAVQNAAPITSSTTLRTPTESQESPTSTQATISVKNSTLTPVIKVLIPAAANKTLFSKTESTVPLPSLDIILLSIAFLYE